MGHAHLEHKVQGRKSMTPWQQFSDGLCRDVIWQVADGHHPAQDRQHPLHCLLVLGSNVQLGLHNLMHTDTESCHAQARN